MRYPIRPKSEMEYIARVSADLMVHEDMTLWQISGTIDIPMSTVYASLMEVLPCLDIPAFRKVRLRLEAHKRRGGKRHG